MDGWWRERGGAAAGQGMRRRGAFLCGRAEACDGHILPFSRIDESPNMLTTRPVAVDVWCGPWAAGRRLTSNVGRRLVTARLTCPRPKTTDLQGVHALAVFVERVHQVHGGAYVRWWWRRGEVLLGGARQGEKKRVCVHVLVCGNIKGQKNTRLPHFTHARAATTHPLLPQHKVRRQRDLLAVLEARQPAVRTPRTPVRVAQAARPAL